MSQKNNASKRRISTVNIVIYLYLLLILLSLLTVASYTWFSLSRTPRVSDMNMYINSQSGLELSTDPLAEDANWVLQLDFRDIVNETSPLRPITWSDKDQKFYTATHGYDGRLMNYDSWMPLTDDQNANKENADGYYIKTTIYARSGVGVDVHLSPAVEVDEGVNGSGTYVIGTPVWDGVNVAHSNGGQGAECAIRIGIRTTSLNETGQAAGAESKFFIYEPNSDAHPDGTTGYVATASIDGTEQLIDEAFLIRQTASSWTEANPVQRSVVIKTLGEFETTPTLFSLQPGELVQIDIYIWLEGQDVDCTNQIEQAQILANIQFAADPATQSGLKPIE